MWRLRYARTIGLTGRRPARPSHRQLVVPGMQGGEPYGAEAKAPTSGARTQLPPLLLIVAAGACREAIWLRADAASVL